MENEQSFTPAGVLMSEHDVAAVVAILIRAIRAQDEITADQEIINEATARLEGNTVTMNKAVSALSFFGFEASDDESVWTQIWNAIGRNAYLKTIAVARGLEHDEGGLLEQMGDDGPPEESAQQEMGGARVPRPVLVRDAILRHLRAVGERGTNVREIKRHLSDAYAMTVHEKTPGMTLYRLLKDGLARREGRTWFATNEELKENEAPNGRTAGASEAGGAATPPYHQPELTDD